tara:strand:+ start:3191 stop:3616 length:426 start_codon:yes stop_codon:yes gene_type:complete
MGTVQTAPKLGSLSFDVSSSSNIGTSFAVAKAATAVLPTLVDSSVRLIPDYLIVRFGSKGAGTKLTIAIATDAAGDSIVVPDTEATIAAGKTSAGVGACGYSIQLPFVASSATTFHLFFKVDAGSTMDISSAELFFRRGAS